MAKLSEKALRKRDATRDIGAELLASVREMKAGKAGHVHRVPVSAITKRARARDSRSNNLPRCSAFQRERCKSGSKADANLRAQRAHSSRLQHVGPKCCVRSLPRNTRAGRRASLPTFLIC